MFSCRVELHKRKVLDQWETEQEMTYEAIRLDKVVQDQTMKRVKGQLLVSMLHVFCTSLINGKYRWIVPLCKHRVAVSVRRQKESS